MEAKARDQLVSKGHHQLDRNTRQALANDTEAQGGHFHLGTKLTVAALKCALMISIIQTLIGSTIILEGKTPARWGLKERWTKTRTCIHAGVQESGGNAQVWADFR
ncbi:unnamed protein product [Mortierella alpina]